MKRKILFLSPLLLIGSIFVWNSREESSYEKFLNNHPFYNDYRTLEEVKALPKKERPDLAEQQNFLMTMNPELKRPTPENLEFIAKEIKRKRLLRAPGTSSTPWVERGPNNVAGRTRAIVFDPNDATNKKVWAGGVSGGLWYNIDITDAESQWVAVGDLWDNMSISSIAFDPNDSQVIYVGTGESYSSAARGAGIWKSVDGGATFNQLENSKSFYYVNDLIVRNESGQSVLYVAVSGGTVANGWFGMDDAGLYRSTDGGSAFTQVLDNVSQDYNVSYAVNNIELDANNKLWIGTKSSAYSVIASGGKIMSSTDGTNWTINYSSNEGRVVVACAPSNANYVYALIESQDVLSSVQKSIDGGNSFSSMNEPDEESDSGIPVTDFTRGQADYDLTLAVDPNNENRIIAGGINLFISEDGASSWEQISKWNEYLAGDFSTVHADQHQITFVPDSSNAIIFSNDGGVYYTNKLDQADVSDVIESRNKGYNVTQYYACAINPDLGSNNFIAGSQDNGTQKYSSEGVNSTEEVSTGDGAYCFIDQDNGDLQISSYIYNNYFVTNDNWSSGFQEVVDDRDGGFFINPAGYDSKQNILYTSYNNDSIMRITDIGGDESSGFVSGLGLGSKASHIYVSEYTESSSTLFIGTSAGKLFKLTNANGGPSVAEITGDNFPSGWISCVDLGASEDEIMVTFSNYGVTSVWYSEDGGSSWASKEGDLPDLPVRSCLFNPNDRTEVILATDLGVWSTNNFSANSPTWKASNSGLATVRVDMLKMRKSDFEVIAATHGRGLFSSNGFASTLDPEANFEVNKDSIQRGESVNFSDLSVGAPSSWNWFFEGGTPSSSSERNPSIEYDSTGVFDVTLIVGRDGMFDTLIKEDYITVLEKDSVSYINCDTLINLDVFKDPLVYQPGNSWGYISGHNSEGYAEYAEEFSDVQGNAVKGIYMYIRNLKYADDSSKIRFKIMTGEGKPSEVLYEQDAYMSNMDSNSFYYLELDTIVDVPSNFFVAWEVFYNNSEQDIFSLLFHQSASVNSFHVNNQGFWTTFSSWNTASSMFVDVCTKIVEPTLAFNIPDSVCVDEEFTLDDQTTGTLESLMWTFGSGASISASPDLGDKTYSYSSSGEKTIKIIAEGPSGESLELEKTIVVVDLPSADFVVQDSVIVDSSLSIQNNSSGAIVSYSWDFGNGDVSDVEVPDYSYSVKGDYDIELEIENSLGCKVVSSNSIVVYEVEVIDEGDDGDSIAVGVLELNEDLKIYPTLISSELIINQSIGQGYLYIYDVAGKLIFEGVLSEGHRTIRTSHWKPGTYFVQIGIGNSQLSKKIVKN